jgi:hypothetical protein
MSDNDEIRAAERRLRAYNHGDHRAYDKPLEPHEIDLDKVQRDQRIIVAAYLNPWRPIDSAPRDGTWVIGLEGEVVSKVRWAYGDWFGPTGGINERVFNPTHWCSLPPAPAA